MEMPWGEAHWDSCRLSKGGDVLRAKMSLDDHVMWPPRQRLARATLYSVWSLIQSSSRLQRYCMFNFYNSCGLTIFLATIDFGTRSISIYKKDFNDAFSTRLIPPPVVEFRENLYLNASGFFFFGNLSYVRRQVSYSTKSHNHQHFLTFKLQNHDIHDPRTRLSVCNLRLRTGCTLRPCLGNL